MEAAINAAVEATASTTTSVLTSNLPEIFVVFAGLLALGIILRLIKRVIGRKA